MMTDVCKQAYKSRSCSTVVESKDRVADFSNKESIFHRILRPRDYGSLHAESPIRHIDRCASSQVILSRRLHCSTMASGSRRTVRNIAPPCRYGFDASSEDDFEDGDDEYLPMSNSGSSSDSDEDDLPTATLPSEGGDNEWQFVLCGEDSGPSDVAFSGSPGMRNDIDTSQWTLRDYILHFMPDTLIEKLTNWTNSCILVKKAEQFCMENTENVPPTKEVSFDEMKTMLGLTFLMV